MKSFLVASTVLASGLCYSSASFLQEVSHLSGELFGALVDPESIQHNARELFAAIVPNENRTWWEERGTDGKLIIPYTFDPRSLPKEYWDQLGFTCEQAVGASFASYCSDPCDGICQNASRTPCTFEMEEVVNIVTGIRMFQNDLGGLVRYVPWTPSAGHPHFLVISGHAQKCSATVGKWEGPSNGVYYPFSTMHVSRGQTFDGGACMGTTQMKRLLMNSLGLSRTTQRPDRDQYVTIKVENVLPSSRDDFLESSWNYTGFGLPYDYGSIMHYRATDFSMNGKVTIDGHGKELGSNTLSELDLFGLKIAYKCSSPRTVSTFCSADCLCDEGEGECRSDDDCSGNLMCIDGKYDFKVCGQPTASPTDTPTMAPSATPSVSPTKNPTTSPTATPTQSPVEGRECTTYEDCYTDEKCTSVSGRDDVKVCQDWYCSPSDPCPEDYSCSYDDECADDLACIGQVCTSETVIGNNVKTLDGCGKTIRLSTSIRKKNLKFSSTKGGKICWILPNKVSGKLLQLSLVAFKGDGSKEFLTWHQLDGAEQVVVSENNRFDGSDENTPTIATYPEGASGAVSFVSNNGGNALFKMTYQLVDPPPIHGCDKVIIKQVPMNWSSYFYQVKIPRAVLQKGYICVYLKVNRIPYNGYFMLDKSVGAYWFDTDIPLRGFGGATKSLDRWLFDGTFTARGFRNTIWSDTDYVVSRFWGPSYGTDDAYVQFDYFPF